MGVCFSSQIKTENPCSNGLSSKCVSVQSKDLSSPSRKVENDLSNSSNKVLVPQTLRSEGEILQSSNLKSFSLTELTAATRNFGSISVLGGEGGFGSVFKGWIDDHSLSAAKPGKGIVVAVKRLNQNSFQGHKAWLARHGMIHEASLEDEVNYLGQLSHPHLVKLIGYCLEDKNCLLVYEFMSRGSLENHLFLRGSYFQPLSWGLRLKVALGAAKGLAFLHRAETKVMYRDFRTSNVLLDSNYNAKLSDFGLVKEGPMVNKNDASPSAFRTYGCAAAPEYIATGHMTAKSDVFSFGVVLLEMISGKRAIDKNRPSGQQNLVEWAKPYLANKSKLLRVLDNRLEGQYTIDEAYKVATLSLRCLATESKLRPDMDEVVTHLEQLQVPHEVRSNQNRSSNSSRPRRKSADDVAHCRVATAVSTFT